MLSSFRKHAVPAAAAAASMLCMSAAAMAQTAPASEPDTQRYAISYICGDARIDGTAPLPPDGRPYNLGVSFASAQSGNPLVNVQVRLRRHGRVLTEFNAAGPRCLFSVPDASYRIEGTYQGETKFAIVETGVLNTQLRW
ncbi:hypothetical protein WI73_15695 [Burkholderia ubonensis]|uniref:Carboxypeptidase regulatory-like domain-containing protein n=1 Tax=Burkholderia ubonensis TaxID=101571 RepID=A0A102NHR1_9BURK|nr:hypothetical protein [Burkholderia ubonensis]KUZ59086.1 hypothetical protein WI35_33710 [Burkholderia ubonensis]KUZ76533.1 hypothetical protein WI37_16425 [Burkholderia ubonensis]KUZ79749.1 hypothetical protein WI36_07835 [Burkholderia ubonensis]KUZ86042.1 hypothetical protein WI38_24440 [Burkholderia ubonensis]KUZ88515.1 hypothetical protein WI40_29295 [Burkholderia ubonensis]